MSIYYFLPQELWPIVGSFIFMDVTEEGDSIRLTVKHASCYIIIYPKDENGHSFVEPCENCSVQWLSKTTILAKKRTTFRSTVLASLDKNLGKFSLPLEKKVILSFSFFFWESGQSKINKCRVTHFFETRGLSVHFFGVAGQTGGRPPRTPWGAGPLGPPP